MKQPHWGCFSRRACLDRRLNPPVIGQKVTRPDAGAASPCADSPEIRSRGLGPARTRICIGIVRGVAVMYVQGPRIAQGVGHAGQFSCLLAWV